ncbi:MAG: SlyX family protein [Phycisphaerales bacterium]
MHEQDHTSRRLTSLEEALLFGERSTDEIRDIAEEAIRRVLVLERRLEALEERLGSLVQPEPDLPEHERPPHSAG